MSYLASKLQAGLGKFAPLAPSVGGDFFADGMIHLSSKYNTQCMKNVYLSSRVINIYVLQQIVHIEQVE